MQAEQSGAASHEVQRARLDEQARAVGQRWLVLRLGDEWQVLAVAGAPGACVVDPAAPDLLDRLIEAGSFDPGACESLGHLAQQAAARGVASRERGDLPNAWLSQRLAAFVAAQLGSANGVKATVANLGIVREALREALDRGNMPLPADPAAREAWHAAAHGLRSDAARLAALLRPRLAAAPADAEGWLALHRLACMSADAQLAREARARLAALGDTAAEHAALAAAEALAELDTEQLLIELDALADRPAGMRRASRGDDGRWHETRLAANPRTSVCSAYQACRSRFVGMGRLKDGLAALQAAHAHLAHMRLRMTAAGGAFGHELSYRVATMLQPVGRDLAMLLLRAGQVQSALTLAESLLARAMGDWMSRTHAVRAVPRPFVGPTAPLSGSINASEPATLQEIAECAARHGPLLYLIALPDAHVG